MFKIQYVLDVGWQDLAIGTFSTVREAELAYYDWVGANGATHIAWKVVEA